MYGDAFPSARPAALRRRSLPPGTTLWRIDAAHPTDWAWKGFATPRHRFDSAMGAFRTRYAARSIEGAFRECYWPTGLLIPSDHAQHHLIGLTATRSLSVVDLRTESNLHALDVDDRINTSHETKVWDCCHRLADASRGWWPDLDGVVYRSRTTPSSSYNLAFFSSAGLNVEPRDLRECAAELDELILHHRFTVDFDY